MIKNSRINAFMSIVIYLGIIACILFAMTVIPNNFSNIKKETVDYEKKFEGVKKEFLDKYGINLITYSEELPELNGMSFEWVKVDERLINSIELLEKALSKLPDNMIKSELKYDAIIKTMKNDMDIYLVTNMYDDELELGGTTLSTVADRDVIFIDVYARNVEYNLYHEIFHVIEMKGIGDFAILFNKVFSGSRWYSYNPQEFDYGDEKKYDYIEFLKGDVEDIYFVTSYSKKSISEDMAEIFAAMMTYEEDDVPYSFYSPHVIDKMRFISEFLEENYESATEDAHWNRWLNSLEESEN